MIADEYLADLWALEAILIAASLTTAALIGPVQQIGAKQTGGCAFIAVAAAYGITELK